MEIFKATITVPRKPPAATAVHDRYFLRQEDAFQTFKNIMSKENGVYIERAPLRKPYEGLIAMKNGQKVAEVTVLKLPLYETARASLDF